jgi:hypothetical protein
MLNGLEIVHRPLMYCHDNQKAFIVGTTKHDGPGGNNLQRLYVQNGVMKINQKIADMLIAHA